MEVMALRLALALQEGPMHPKVFGTLDQVNSKLYRNAFFLNYTGELALMFVLFRNWRDFLLRQVPPDHIIPGFKN